VCARACVWARVEMGGDYALADARSYTLDVSLHYACGAGWIDFGAPEGDEAEDHDAPRARQGGGVPAVKRTRDIVGWHIAGSPFAVAAVLPEVLIGVRAGRLSYWSGRVRTLQGARHP
jgi:hypothetical protein